MFLQSETAIVVLVFFIEEGDFGFGLFGGEEIKAEGARDVVGVHVRVQVEVEEIIDEGVASEEPKAS